MEFVHRDEAEHEKEHEQCDLRDQERRLRSVGAKACNAGIFANA